MPLERELIVEQQVCVGVGVCVCVCACVVCRRLRERLAWRARRPSMLSGTVKGGYM